MNKLHTYFATELNKKEVVEKSDLITILLCLNKMQKDQKKILNDNFYNEIANLMKNEFDGLLFEFKCLLLNDLLLISTVDSNYPKIKKFVSSLLRDAKELITMVDFNAFYAMLKLYQTFEAAIAARSLEDYENFYQFKSTIGPLSDSLADRMNLYSNQFTEKNIQVLILNITNQEDLFMRNQLVKILQALIETLDKQGLYYLWGKSTHCFALSLARDKDYVTLKDQLDALEKKIDWQLNVEYEQKRHPEIVYLSEPL